MYLLFTIRSLFVVSEMTVGVAVGLDAGRINIDGLRNITTRVVVIKTTTTPAQIHDDSDSIT